MEKIKRHHGCRTGYAMDAMLYMTCGIVDRKDDDIMLETAICKVFCSEYGFRTIDHALQVMGGEGYMTKTSSNASGVTAASTSLLKVQTKSCTASCLLAAPSSLANTCWG